MRPVPKIVPISDLRRGIAEVVAEVQASGEPTVLTQRGRAAAVLVSVGEYERAQYERELLRALAAGQAEIKAGKGASLRSVLAEADALLAAKDEA